MTDLKLCVAKLSSGRHVFVVASPQKQGQVYSVNEDGSLSQHYDKAARIIFFFEKEVVDIKTLAKTLKKQRKYSFRMLSEALGFLENCQVDCETIEQYGRFVI